MLVNRRYKTFLSLAIVLFAIVTAVLIFTGVVRAQDLNQAGQSLEELGRQLAAKRAELERLKMQDPGNEPQNTEFVRQESQFRQREQKFYSDKTALDADFAQWNRDNDAANNYCAYKRPPWGVTWGQFVQQCKQKRANLDDRLRGLERRRQGLNNEYNYVAQTKPYFDQGRRNLNALVESWNNTQRGIIIEIRRLEAATVGATTTSTPQPLDPTQHGQCPPGLDPEAMKRCLDNIYNGRGTQGGQLSDVRRKIAGLQDALRRVEAARQIDDATSDEWMQATSAAVDDASARGTEMVLGGVEDIANKILDRHFQQQESEDAPKLDANLDALIEASGMERQQQLKADIQELLNRRGNRQEMQRTLAQLRQDSRATDLTVLETAHDWMTQVLNDQSVQRYLRLNPGYGKAAVLSKSLVDSGYDIAVECITIRRIQQVDRNGEARLRAVARLHERMKEAVQRLNELDSTKPPGVVRLPAVVGPLPTPTPRPPLIPNPTPPRN
jgi:hypothetical protein